MAITEFEKDFGYLMPFLDKIAAAASASTLPDQAARAELEQLIADEKRRWARIRQLLSGTSTGESKPVAAVAGEAPSATVKQQPSFTVGSLRQRKS